MKPLLTKEEAAKNLGVGVPYLLELVAELGIVPVPGWKKTDRGRRQISMIFAEDLPAFRARMKAKRENRLARSIEGRRDALKKERRCRSTKPNHNKQP